MTTDPERPTIEHALTLTDEDLQAVEDFSYLPAGESAEDGEGMSE
jgi:hypothetical protein